MKRFISSSLWNEFTKQIVDMIDAKDVVGLRKWMNGINPQINRLFSKLTGLPAKTQKEANASLRQLNPEAWDKREKERKEESDKREQERGQKELDRELSTKTKYQDKIITRKELYDQLISEGYLVVAEVQKGAVKQYRIENPTDGRVINIPNKIEYEYVKGLVEAKKAEGKASPDEFTKQGNKNIYDAIRELSRGEQQAAWTEGVSKGDTLKIGGKSYTVQSNSDKLLRLKREDGKIFSFKKYGKSRTFAADGKEADLFRKVEGDLTRDLLAQYNQFHTPSDVFNLTRRVIEARNNPMYGKPEVKAAAKSEVKSGELIPTQPEDEKVYFFEPLEKEISVEDMQKIVDANEKLVKED